MYLYILYMTCTSSRVQGSKLQTVHLSQVDPLEACPKDKLNYFVISTPGVSHKFCFYVSTLHCHVVIARPQMSSPFSFFFFSFFSLTEQFSSGMITLLLNPKYVMKLKIVV